MATSQMSEVIQCLRRVLRDGAGPTDGQLLEDYISRRDEAAVAAIVGRHGPMVWGVCRRVLHNHHDAEDAFQATFLVLVRRAASIASRDLLANWLYGVAYQTALKARATAIKRMGRERQVANMPEPLDRSQGAGSRSQGSGISEQEWLEVQGLLDQELSRLPDIYRGVLVLCDLEGKTRSEAGRHWGLPEGTVASRLARARTMLAKRLTQRGVVLSGGTLAAVLTHNVASAGVPASVVSSTISAASLVAAGQTAAAGLVSIKAAALAEGVLSAMMMSKLKAVLAVVVLLGLIATGVTALSGRTTSAHHDQSPAAEAPAKSSEATSQWPETRDKLKQIGSAMKSYFDTHQVYPAPALFSKAWKPLLSWRVALLPYLNEGDLYRQFRLDEPWDSVHNKKLLAKMPAVYRRAGAKDNTATPFQIFVGKGTMFEGPAGLGYRDIPDGISNTIAVVEAADAVPWTKPEDLPYSATGKLPELGGELPEVTHALFADSTVHALKRRFDSDALRLAITRDDGIPTPWDKLRAPASHVGDQEKEPFTAWGKEVGGLQAGLGFRPGEQRVYHLREGVAVVLRVRNVGKEAVEFNHIWAFFPANPPIITGADGKVIQLLPGYRALGLQRPRSANVAPGKEVELYEWSFDLRPQGESGNKGSLTIHGSGKFSLQCERIVGPTMANPNHPNPAMDKLATGKLELEVKEEEKEGFTAWGKDVGGLQAGLGFRPGAKRAYSHGETVPLVVRVRNVGTTDVPIVYDHWIFQEKPPVITDAAGKAVRFGGPDYFGSAARVPKEVSLAPGKQIDLAEKRIALKPAPPITEKKPGESSLGGSGRFLVQYQQLTHPDFASSLVLGKLATGKLELEVKEEEKEAFTAWGEEVAGLQAGLGYRPGAKRTYSHGETVPLVVRVRNVSKEDVKFEYINAFFIVFPPAVTDAKGKPIPQAGGPVSGRTGVRTTVNLAPGKEIELCERKLVLGPEFGTGKVQIQYKRVFPPRDPREEDGSGIAVAGVITLDPTGGKLATGKLEVEIKAEPRPDLDNDEDLDKTTPPEEAQKVPTDSAKDARPDLLIFADRKGPPTLLPAEVLSLTLDSDSYPDLLIFPDGKGQPVLVTSEILGLLSTGESEMDDAAHDGSAEKLYRTMEKTVRAAKSLHVALDSEVDSQAIKGTAKATIYAAQENKSRMEIDFEMGGKADKLLFLTDGQAHYTKQGDKGTLDANPKKAAEQAKLVPVMIARIGITGAMLMARSVKPGEEKQFDLDKDAPVTNFKLGAKEMVGVKTAQVVTYRLDFDGTSAKMSVWIDTKTQLPLKRVLTAEQAGQMFRITETYSTFAIDPKLEPKLFEIPKE